jgi:dinuclear metal center YbgI/SA1388 family protein
MKVREVVSALEELAPLSLQESYDNAGLIAGDPEMKVSGVLCTVDITSKVIEEALKLQANLIISHHPILFSGLKTLTGKTAEEKVLIAALKNDLALYAAHTNLDKVKTGVNAMICTKLGLEATRILAPEGSQLFKLVCFIPGDHLETVRTAIFEAGAGMIGNYDSCSFTATGEGTFRGNELTDPFVGEKGKLHTEKEVRFETILTKTVIPGVIQAMIASHPYEEVAYDLYPLENKYEAVGSGMLGNFPEPVTHENFLQLLRKTFEIPVIRYAGEPKKQYRKIAVCGGAGSFLISRAIRARADAFITGDLKYHQFFEATDNMLICDIGHYESEQFTKEIFYSVLKKKFSTFAVHLSETVTNPIKYFL